MQYKFLDLAQEVLEREKRPLDYLEIWKKAVEWGLDKKLNSLGKTPDQTLGARLYCEEKKQKSRFVRVSSRPIKFALAEWSESQKQEFDNPDDINKKRGFKERDLHPLLAKFLFDSPTFGLYTKTIYHEKSHKKGKSEWLHPDMVGVYFPFGDYQSETLSILRHLDQAIYKLYSFEIKIDLDFGNLREAFFQAVSNSSWANEGYLVALNINQEIMPEFRRLNASFGIGLIQLRTDVLDSKILIPAHQRDNLDVATLDLLVEKNPDFKEFIINANEDIKGNNLHRIVEKNYDRVLEDEVMEKYIQDKGITEES